MKARHEFESDATYSDYLRAYFSMQFMRALITNSDYPNQLDFPKAVKKSIEYADELLKQLEDGE